MNVFNRAFIFLLAIGWLVLMGVLLYLIWEQNRTIDWSSDNLRFAFDIVLESRSAKILASLIVGLMALPALVLLVLELKPSRYNVTKDSRYRQLEARNRDLERELEEERQRARPSRVEGVPAREVPAVSREARLEHELQEERRGARPQTDGVPTSDVPAESRDARLERELEEERSRSRPQPVEGAASGQAQAPDTEAPRSQRSTVEEGPAGAGSEPISVSSSEQPARDTRMEGAERTVEERPSTSSQQQQSRSGSVRADERQTDEASRSDSGERQPEEPRRRGWRALLGRR